MMSRRRQRLQELRDPGRETSRSLRSQRCSYEDLLPAVRAHEPVLRLSTRFRLACTPPHAWSHPAKVLIQFRCMRRTMLALLYPLSLLRLWFRPCSLISTRLSRNPFCI